MPGIYRTIVLALLAVQPISTQPSDQHVLGGSERDMIHVHDSLANAQIIPTVIDDFTPVFGLEASWESDAASLGNTLDPSKLQSSPTVRLENAESDSNSIPQNAAQMTYVLALTDPDAPSRDNPKWAEFCHWVATGIQIPSKSGISSLHLQDIVEYKPPGPPPKTGKHRYVFLVFAPANGTTDGLNLTTPKERKHWGSDHEGHGVRNWAHDNGLVPVAANFIYAQNDEQ
ncbi:hypothetical protein AK830_g12405 [Neonectria ditissima]|uniref:Carboxypeptidase Y inhibitor n=1 Tax=Neonectria ditissima TaxID=78410 RepID=A0A0P7B5H6_9HYPO|nr:hypothetical protein AK830_g12405 [Neonectria ditissima]